MEKHPAFEFNGIEICGLHKIRPFQILDFYIRNKSHLANSMPIRPPEFYQEDYWQQAINNYKNDFLADRAVKFILKHMDKMIGSIVCDQIVRGPFQACFLGYALDEAYQGQGIMTHSLQHIIEYLFKEFKLNRIMANYIPNNKKSEKILLNLNFEKEGYARKYLKINGDWQDHILTSCINKGLV